MILRKEKDLLNYLTQYITEGEAESDNPNLLLDDRLFFCYSYIFFRQNTTLSVQRGSQKR